MAHVKLTDRQMQSFLSKQRLMPSGCIEWQASVNEDGYGTLFVRPRHWKAHRLAWVLANGPVPAGRELMHSCDNPRCVNVAHLSPGTHSENMRDAYARGRKKVPGTFLKAASRCKEGSLNPKARLSAEDVAAIRASSDPINDLAARFGVTPQNVRLILARKTWGHV